MLAGTTNLRRLDQVEHFWDTVDTIGEGFGFSLFGARHLVTLALYIGFAALSCKLSTRRRMRRSGRSCGGSLPFSCSRTRRSNRSVCRSAGISAGTICRCTCARSTFSLSRCTHGSRAGCSTIFSIYLYPRGDGGTAVPDVDVASGGELHVLAFDERAHSACGLSHHAVFGR